MSSKWETMWQHFVPRPKTTRTAVTSANWTWEGPLGFPMADGDAKQLQQLLKQSPTGSEWEYKRESWPTQSSTVSAERTEISIITSETPDREREVILASGIDDRQFLKNPIVTFAHRYDILPVGRALWIQRSQGEIQAKTRYTERPPHWFGEWFPDAVWHFIQVGDLPGKSIGFLPLQGRTPTARERQENPAWQQVDWIYTKTLLLEYAVAPIPANAEALVQTVGKIFCHALPTHSCSMLSTKMVDDTTFETLAPSPQTSRVESSDEMGLFTSQLDNQDDKTKPLFFDPHQWFENWQQALVKQMAGVDWQRLAEERLARWCGHI